MWNWTEILHWLKKYMMSCLAAVVRWGGIELRFFMDWKCVANVIIHILSGISYMHQVITDRKKENRRISWRSSRWQCYWSFLLMIWVQATNSPTPSSKKHEQMRWMYWVFLSIVMIFASCYLYPLLPLSLVAAEIFLELNILTSSFLDYHFGCACTIMYIAFLFFRNNIMKRYYPVASRW